MGVELRDYQESLIAAIPDIIAKTFWIHFVRWPTGAGKSLPILVSAANRRFVVIAPLIALADQWVDSARRAGLLAVPLHSKAKGHEKAALDDLIKCGAPGVIVSTPESACNNPEVIRWAEMITADEIHFALDWFGESRTAYERALKTVADMGKPIIGLSATIRNSDAAELAELLKCDKSLESLDRVLPDLSITRINATPVGSLRHVMAIPECTSILAFGDTIRDCESIAESLDGVEAYHSKLKGPLKRDRLERFNKGDLRAIVTTTALGAGIDTKCTDVILMYLPGTVESALQEMGRATRGRSGRVWVATHENTMKRALRTSLENIPTVTDIAAALNTLDASESSGEPIWTKGHMALLPDISWQRVAATVRLLAHCGAILETDHGISLLNPDDAMGRIWPLRDKIVTQRNESWRHLTQWLKSGDPDIVRRYLES